jgi:uncharacterized low-complexity protein
MSKKFELKPLTAAIGAILATSAFAIPTASADENPFQITELTSGYMVAEKEGKCGEGKCGGMKMKEGKCGMKMMMKKMDADEDGAISKEEFMQHHEKKFDKKDKNEDGKLTEDEMKMMKEGKCGMKMKEGKCGEGKCGGMKSEDKTDS